MNGQVGAAEPFVAMVVTTHNRRERLLATLAHIHAQADARIVSIVAFDGCTDGSQEAVRQAYPDVVQVEGDGSLWWSGCINAGIEAGRKLGADYFCLLNDDVRPDSGMVAALLRAEEQNPGAVIGPIIFYEHDHKLIWSAGGQTDWRGRGISMMGNNAPDAPEWHTIRRAKWLPGMGTLVPVSVIDRIGMMDAHNFPQYFGDTDFGLRATRAGIPVLVCPDAVLYNDIGSTGMLLPKGPIGLDTVRTLFFSQRSHSNLRTRWRFWWRHCPLPLIPWQALRFYGPICAVVLKKLTWDQFRRAIRRRPVF